MGELRKGFALDEETYRWLKRLALENDGNQSQTIRKLIRLEADRRGWIPKAPVWTPPEDVRAL